MVEVSQVASDQGFRGGITGRWAVASRDEDKLPNLPARPSFESEVELGYNGERAKCIVELPRFPVS